MCKDGCCMLHSSSRKIRRAAGIVCYDTKKDTFLMVQEKGKWGFPKGMVEKNDTPIKAAIRSLKIKAGIDLSESENDLTYFGECKGVDLFYIELDEAPLVFTEEVDGVGYISKKCFKANTFKFDYFMKFVQLQ